MAPSRPHFRSFSYKQDNFYNNVMWKNIQPVSGAGFQTHYLLNVSLLP